MGDGCFCAACSRPTTKRHSPRQSRDNARNTTPALTRPPEYHRPARKRPVATGPEKETAWLTPVSTTPRLAPTGAAPHRTCSQSLERPPQAPSFTSRDQFVKLMAPGRWPLCIAPQVAKPDLCPVLCGLSSQLRPKPLLPTRSNANTTGQQPLQVIQRFLPGQQSGQYSSQQDAQGSFHR